MRSAYDRRVVGETAVKFLTVASFAALLSGCGLSNSNALWDEQPTGSVTPPPSYQPAADPIITGTNQPYTPYSQTQRVASAGRAVVVRPGDTAYSIAKRNGTTVQALASANNLRPPYNIGVGQRLFVPGARADYTRTGSIRPNRQPAPSYQAPMRPAQVVVVQPGDTLYSIGRRYGVHVSNLARLNRIPPPYNIRLGQRIQIPARAGAAPQRAQAPRLTPQAQPQRARPPQVTAAAPGRAATSPNKDYIYYFHKVKSGETLQGIAQQYRVEPSTLSTFNQLPLHARLRPGQVIRVPM